ncbi:hypothetical protein R6258_07800 [Halomonas sp. HP20-15]|uniref:hypothetical protein n=1 Tax=Halomonas sp. HP20-15 TaxID=3085901 RepID=UPI0029815557|nr:hypothetical protein [Halomonas sp. HP20-15]MDW5376823.1 hypothetical protein [Halomonas sp. HP20-15]
MRRIEDMGIGELLGIISREPEGERRERALATALSSLIEVEIEWRLDLRHQNAGYHKASSIAGAGEARGQLTGRVDHVGLAAERYRYACRWRSMASALLAHLNERQRMAVLLCGYAIPEHRHQRMAMGQVERHHAVLSGDRGLTLAEVCDSQLVVLKRLGWAPGAGYAAGEWVAFKPVSWSLAPARHNAWHARQRMRQLQEPGSREVFSTMRAMRDTAWRARAKLLPLVVQQAKMAIKPQYVVKPR